MAQPLPLTWGRHQQCALVRCTGCTASPCSWPSYGLACHTCSTPSLGQYLRRLWRGCHRHRQPRPSHHRPCRYLYRLVRAFPTVRLFFSRGPCCREMPGSLPPPRSGMHPSLQPSTSIVQPLWYHHQHCSVPITLQLPIPLPLPLPFTVTIATIITITTTTYLRLPLPLP